MPNEQNGGAPSLLGLFAPPSPAVTSKGEATRRNQAKQNTSSNEKDAANDDDDVTTLPTPPRQSNNEQTPLLSSDRPQERSSSLRSLFDDSAPSSPWNDNHQTTTTPKTSGSTRKTRPSVVPNLPELGSLLPPIREVPVNDDTSTSPSKQERSSLLPTFDQLQAALQTAAQECANPSTWIGGFMFLLFQVVYSLTMGATIIRPHGSAPILGLMTKMAALGIIFGAPVYWLNLRDVPALYPTVDLFSAPFLANMALIVDQALFEDHSVSEEDNDQVFLASFTFLASVSLFVSGSLLVLASVFKLANLGAFLPYPVLCGFFSAVGVLTWTLAFKVDSNGVAASEVFFSGDWGLILHAACHHLPSVIVGALMKYLGPKNNFYTVAMVGVVIVLFYAYMLAFSVSMDEMIEREWFWSKSDLHYEPKTVSEFRCSTRNLIHVIAHVILSFFLY